MTLPATVRILINNLQRMFEYRFLIADRKQGRRNGLILGQRVVKDEITIHIGFGKLLVRHLYKIQSYEI